MPSIEQGALFRTEAWSGPASMHYDGKLKRYVQRKSAETDPLVANIPDKMQFICLNGASSPAKPSLPLFDQDQLDE